MQGNTAYSGRGLIARSVTVVLAVLAVAVTGMAAVALAKAFALHVVKAAVTNTQAMTTHERIVVNARNFAVYELTGDSKRHPECTRANGCFDFWPPVTVASASKATKASAVKGRLATWHRNGFIQLTLNGHPLYTYAGDTRSKHATGQGIVTFGGTWHVIRER